MRVHSGATSGSPPPYSVAISASLGMNVVAAYVSALRQQQTGRLLSPDHSWAPALTAPARSSVAFLISRVPARPTLCFCRETLRRDPVVAGLMRVAAKDFELNGYKVPQGKMLMLPLKYLSAHDPRFQVRVALRSVATALWVPSSM